MRSSFPLFLICFICACSPQEQQKEVSSKYTPLKALLPDTSFGFAKIHISQEFKNGQLHEYKQYYFDSSIIAMQGWLINHLKENWWEEFHVNGNMKSKGNYHQGKKVGEWISYHANGSLKELGEYEDNKKNGWWKTYNKNKELTCEGNYVLGKKQGYWINYKDQKKESEGNYEKGKAAGLWKYYKENGELVNTFDFE